MANLVYMATETAITWRASGGTEPITLTSLGADAGRQGDHYNFTTADRSRKYQWRAWIVPSGTRVPEEMVHIYLKRGNGTNFDNDMGVSDIAMAAGLKEKLLNCLYLGTIHIDEDAAVEMGTGGEIEISDQYVAPVFWNDTANALSATPGDFGFDLTPVPDEIQ